MKKRIFSLFTSLIMVISLVAVMPMMTAGAETSGDYEYEILDDGTVEITKYNGSAKTLAIPSTIAGKKVTSIGFSAFSDCDSLTSVTIPDSVTSIGDETFYGCKSLARVTVDPNNKKYSSQDGVLFNKNKTELIRYPIGNTRTSYTIPNSVKSIKDTAFWNCTRLTSITIPGSVTSIGYLAFGDCSSLISINIPDSVTNIVYNAFLGCKKLKSINIPIGITDISYSTFGGCSSLTSVTIPDGVTSIGEWAFEGCSGLTNVTIGKNVSIIGPQAFNGCTNLKSVTIPKSVIEIQDSFNGCKSLKDVYYAGSENDWKKIKIYGDGLKNATIHFNTPMVVSGFKTAATSAQAVKLTWNKVSGARGYVVYRASAGKWVRVGVVKTNSFYEGKLKSGTSYRYAVKAYKTFGGKNYYSPSYPTLWTSTNPATVNFTLTSGSNKAVAKWSKVTGATGYKVYYKTSAKGKWVGLKTTTATSYTKTGLTKGKTYYFTVKAYRTVNGKTYNGAFVAKSVRVK